MLKLEFTPLEFETDYEKDKIYYQEKLEFTPLEFETLIYQRYINS